MSETTGAPGGYGAMPPVVEPPPVVPIPPPFSAPRAEPAGSLDPWVSIWTRPRATIRQILDGDPHRSVIGLAALGGFAGALRTASAPSIGDVYPVPTILAVAATGGALGGILLLLVFGNLVPLVGRLLGGKGGTREVIAALAWAQVPQIWGLLLWIPRAALLGQETFQSLPTLIEGNPPATAFFGFLWLSQLVIGLWGSLVVLKCVGEAHRFSALRALGALVLVVLLVGVPVDLVMMAVRALG